MNSNSFKMRSSSCFFSGVPFCYTKNCHLRVVEAFLCPCDLSWELCWPEIGSPEAHWSQKNGQSKSNLKNPDGKEFPETIRETGTSTSDRAEWSCQMDQMSARVNWDDLDEASVPSIFSSHLQAKPLVRMQFVLLWLPFFIVASVDRLVWFCIDVGDSDCGPAHQGGRFAPFSKNGVFSGYGISQCSTSHKKRIPLAGK